MSAQKRQKLPPADSARLWIVATPIGNLEDLSPRAKRVLGEAAVVLCEDTRRTRAMFSALGIEARLERLDAHASEREIERWVGELQAGRSVALVSDAGTPAVSDPGAALVEAARRAGVPVSPIPGPSAVTTLLSAAGAISSRFAFRGFFPREKKDVERELGAFERDPSMTWVWFESPRRIGESLSRLAERLPKARVFAGKELTKLHERFFAGHSSAVADEVRAEIAREGELGEWTFCVSLDAADDEKIGEENPSESSEWVKALACLLDCRIPAPEAAKRVSQYFGVARKIAYERAVELSGKKNLRRD